MPIPETIRSIERPINTIVQDTGRNGSKRYIVRERKSIFYVKGCNPQPVNGKTIGYIFDGKFIPIGEKMAPQGPKMLSFGMSTLIKNLSDDIFVDLSTVFDLNDTCTIISMAALKVQRPRITAGRMAAAYENSFTSRYYPGSSLSKNSVSMLYRKLGMDTDKRGMFFQKRFQRVAADHHIAIDGTLKQDNGKFNDLSAFSHKARIKGCADISVIYAYDIELKEPICGQVFPGNSIDAVSYRSFLNDNQIKKGIIIADKGFPPNNIREELKANPELHYLTPVKRNDKRIGEQSLLDFDGILGKQTYNIQFSKRKISDSMFLYAFRDSGRASMEEKSYLQKVKESGKYDQEAYSEKSNQFGLIIFESDLDMNASDVYECYSARWDLEMVFKAYKSDLELDRTSVHGDFSIIGNEFVNFISSIITCRIITKATDAGLFEEMTYEDLVDDLNSAWRIIDVPEGTEPKTNDGYWVHTIPKVAEIMEKLGLSKPQDKPEPKKRGRKSKPAVNTEDVVKTERNAPVEKRKAGRPRIHPIVVNEAKRPVGRPRTRPLPDSNLPKRPVGRPKKNVSIIQNQKAEDETTTVSEKPEDQISKETTGQLKT